MWIVLQKSSVQSTFCSAHTRLTRVLVIYKNMCIKFNAARHCSTERGWALPTETALQHSEASFGERNRQPRQEDEHVQDLQGCSVTPTDAVSRPKEATEAQMNTFLLGIHDSFFFFKHSLGSEQDRKRPPKLYLTSQVFYRD